VVIEAGHLVDLGGRQPQLAGQRHQVAGCKRAETILYPVQVLDEQVAAPRHRPQAFLHLVQGPGIMDVPLGGTAHLALVAVV
jgi:hypothetical protein